MPKRKATVLKPITRAICPGSSPAWVYRRMRTAPPDSGPRPMVLDKA